MEVKFGVETAYWVYHAITLERQIFPDSWRGMRVWEPKRSANSDKFSVFRHAGSK